jgi:hypothetical protein
MLKVDVFAAIAYLYALTNVLATHIVGLTDMFVEARHGERRT